MATTTSPDVGTVHRTHDDALTTLLHEEDAVGFAKHGDTLSESVRKFVHGLERALAQTGRAKPVGTDDSPRLVINVTTGEAPTPYRRRSKAVFVVSVIDGPAPDEALKACYPYLIKTLSNALLYVTPGGGGSKFDVHLITPERGHVHLSSPPGSDEPLFQELAQRLLPIATSHLIIENEFDEDLPEDLWKGDAHTQRFLAIGRRLDALNLLPAPFDLHELLPPEDLKHLRRLYQMGGLSHGNMSERLDGQRFWMSASGVDKRSMREVGRDILLVKEFSPERLSMRLSVPPSISPRRVSVDAIEHWMIYREHPRVGAILHVHAWMDDVVSTQVPYPCGTVELAHAVATLIHEAPVPERAVVGLKNHGLTITGTSLSEIMERVGDQLIPQIPMH